MSSGCKGCTQRHVGCHTGCQVYADYLRDLDERKACKPDEYEIHGYVQGEIGRRLHRESRTRRR